MWTEAKIPLTPFLDNFRIADNTGAEMQLAGDFRTSRGVLWYTCPYREDLPMISRGGIGLGFKSVFCGCLALLLLASACNQHTPADTRAADENTIRELEAQWARTAADNDLEGSVSYYSDDASILPPNAPIASGKQAIRSVWASVLGPGVSLSWQVSKLEVSRSGDLAYVMGAYQFAQKDPQGKTVTDHGKTVEVWKKQPDGKWKAVVDIFNSDLPLSPVPEKEK
jgi:uncharacterized protein (TIGR02246 family)